MAGNEELLRPQTQAEESAMTTYIRQWNVPITDQIYVPEYVRAAT